MGRTDEKIFRRIWCFQVLVGLGVGVWLLSGCATSLEREARAIEERTYELSLRRQIQSYLYGMSCPALLPLAADRLWEQGYGDSTWLGDREGLVTTFREVDWDREVQYEILSQSIGEEQCAIQAIRRRVQRGGEELRERDPEWELRFLDYVDPEQGARLRFRARQEADGAYRRVKEEYGAEK